MQDNLNSKYKSIVDFLQMSSEIYFNETGIKVKIEIVNDFSFNARVSKIEEKALASGAIKANVEDLREEFITTTIYHKPIYGR